MARRSCPADPTDVEWEILSNLIPSAKSNGRPRGVTIREVLNALLCQKRTGCQWGMRPNYFPPKSTVHECYAQLRDDGT